MRYVKVSGIALNTVPNDVKGNLKKTLDALAEARTQGAQIVVFPELTLSGYGCEALFLHPRIATRSLQALAEFLPNTKGLVVSIGLPLTYKKSLFNCNAIISDGKLLGFVAKRFLAGDGVHYEQRYFKGWVPGIRSDIFLEMDQQTYPIGDLIFDLQGLRIGSEICEDAWAADRPGRKMAYQGVDLILSPNASHFALGKIETRRNFCREGSRAFNCAIIYANLLGNESGSIIFDGGTIIASGGKVLAQGPRLSFKEYVVTTAVVDVQKNRSAQSDVVSFAPELVDNNTVIKVGTSPIKESPFEVPSPRPLAWEEGADIRFEEFSRATALGLFDYFRKTKQEGFAVSLSGGKDSCSVGVMIRDMVDLAIAELGIAGFVERFKHCAWLKPFPKRLTAADIVGKILFTFYQQAEASSEATLNSARKIAANLGATFKAFEITGQAELMQQMCEGYVDRKLTWDTDDITLQNIKARVRGVNGWTIANALKLILIPPGNMSEIIVGYFTQGGDDSGALNPIGGIRKSFINKWLKWREVSSPVGLAPMPWLSVANVLAPSAELRPIFRGVAQTDEGELGPYDFRDYLEDLFVWDRKTPLEIFEQLSIELKDRYTFQEMGKWIKLFFVLFMRSQWKRERLPVTFHLDDHNLCPRSWLRWPVISNGFEEELAELDVRLSLFD